MPSPTVLIPTAAGLLLLAGAYQLWNRRNRAYHSSESVAAAYDAWTDDQLLESLWGEHVHLGHYGSPPQPRDFRQAKADFVNQDRVFWTWVAVSEEAPGSSPVTTA
jgi:MPBQ/MSBQ methyltransferase